MGIGLWTSFILLWIVVIVQTIVLLEVLRQIGVLRLRLGDEPAALYVDGEGLERGATAPSLESAQLIGSAPGATTDLAIGKNLITFLTTRCESCRSLVPAINQVAQRRPDVRQFVVCSNPDDTPSECSSLATEFTQGVSLLFDPRQQIFKSYGVRRTPSAALVIDNRIHVHAIPNNREHLEAIIDEEVTISNSEWVLKQDADVNQDRNDSANHLNPAFVSVAERP
jgi:thiol-disulfide isomerase/thioredoxin